MIKRKNETEFIDIERTTNTDYNGEEYTTDKIIKTFTREQLANEIAGLTQTINSFQAKKDNLSAKLVDVDNLINE